MRPARRAAAAAAAVVLAGVAPAAATPDPPLADGPPCRYHAVYWDVVDDEWHGALTGAVTASGRTVSLTCAVHVADRRHDGVAVASASTGPSSGAAVLAPHPASFVGTADDWFAVCATATVDGTPWHWTGTAWSADPAAPCPARPPLDPTDLLDCLNAVCLPQPDPVVCDVLTDLDPYDVPGVVEVRPDGDVDVADEPFWDCPPYQWWGS